MADKPPLETNQLPADVRKAVLAELREFAARGSFRDYDRRKIELAFLREFEAKHKANES
jgi:hypothetical protein